MSRGSTGASSALEIRGVLGPGASLGLESSPVRRLGSPVAQTPEKSGLPFAIRGAGAAMSTLPSGLRGTPAVGYFTHCAARGAAATEANRAGAMSATLRRSVPDQYSIGLRIHQCMRPWIAGVICLSSSSFFLATLFSSTEHVCFHGAHASARGASDCNLYRDCFMNSKRVCWRLLGPALLLSTTLSAQWLNYPEPGVPRLKDGKVNLNAPAPRTGGKPDLSGVWLHERTSPEELRRLFGGALADELEASPIGMEIGTAHKYAMNILIDLKPGESILTPAGEAAMKERAAERDVSNVCHGEYGWPVAGLLTEPFKIVQTPKLTLILYEIDSMRRQ